MSLPQWRCTTGSQVPCMPAQRPGAVLQRCNPPCKAGYIRRQVLVADSASSFPGGPAAELDSQLQGDLVEVVDQPNPTLTADETAALASPEVGNIVPAIALSTREDIDGEEAQSAEEGERPVLSKWGRKRAMLTAILMFAGPALAIPLGDPLMSLIDTISIGRFASTLELAALGPNTLIFQFATYLVASLATANTCLMSEKLDEENSDEAASVLSTSLCIGAIIGFLEMVILLVWGTKMIAATGCAQDLIGPAASYLKIRAFSAPSVLVLMVAQSGLLAQKDSFTPMLGVIIAVIANVGGDALMIGCWGMGLVGAAWATVISQWAGCIVTLLCLPGGNRVKPRLGIKKQDINNLMETFGPATLILLCKNIIYVCVTGTAAALPKLQAAAHQPLYGVWSLGGFAHSPLEQAALAFVPHARTHGQGREVVGLILGLAVAVGVVTALFTAGIPTLLPQMFTTDARLFPLIQSVAPQALLSIFFCALDVASSGILIASKDLGHLVKIIAVAMPMMLGILHAVRKNSWGLAGVWWTLVAFFAFRAVNSISRILYLSRQGNHYLHSDNQTRDPAALMRCIPNKS